MVVSRRGAIMAHVRPYLDTQAILATFEHLWDQRKHTHFSGDSQFYLLVGFDRITNYMANDDHNKEITDKIQSMGIENPIHKSYRFSSNRLAEHSPTRPGKAIAIANSRDTRNMPGVKPYVYLEDVRVDEEG